MSSEVRELIERLDTLAKLATRAPWGPVDPMKAWVLVPDRDAPICAMLWPTEMRSEEETRANAELIVELVNAWPAISEALRALPEVQRGG